MNKNQFYTKILLYVLFVIFPLTALAIGLLSTSHGEVGVIIGAIIALCVDAYFLKKLYDYYLKNKDLLDDNSQKETTPNEKKYFNNISNQQRTILAQELLISHYMELSEQTAIELQLQEIFEKYKPLIQGKIKAFILEQEKINGTDFLAEDAESNENVKTLNSLIGKYAYAVTLYYLYDLQNNSNIIKLANFNDVIESIIAVLDKDQDQHIFDEDSTIYTLITLIEQELILKQS